MRPPDPSSLASRITARITRGPGDRLWAFTDFDDLGNSHAAIAATLSRLVKAGELRRVRRGVYYRPAATAFGESRPDPEAALGTALRRYHAKATPGGMDVWRRMGLTTQVSGESELLSPRRIRIEPVLGIRVRNRVRPATALVDQKRRALLEAIRSVRHIPGATTSEVLDRLRALLREEKDLTRLVRMALGEPPRVRSLLGALLEDARSKGTAGLRAELHDSLNPLTTYRIPGVASHLSTARTWGIR